MRTAAALSLALSVHPPQDVEDRSLAALKRLEDLRRADPAEAEKLEAQLLESKVTTGPDDKPTTWPLLHKVTFTCHRSRRHYAAQQSWDPGPNTRVVTPGQLHQLRNEPQAFGRVVTEAEAHKELLAAAGKIAGGSVDAGQLAHLQEQLAQGAKAFGELETRHADHLADVEAEAREKIEELEEQLRVATERIAELEASRPASKGEETDPEEQSGDTEPMEGKKARKFKGAAS